MLPFQYIYTNTENGNGKQKAEVCFPWSQMRQTINGSRRLLFQQTCPFMPMSVSHRKDLLTLINFPEDF